MSKKYILLLFVVSFFLYGFSQKSINNYKYVVVPYEFDFFSEPNKYRMNELLEFLFNKHGYKAFLDNEDLPDELNANPCSAMYAVVKNIKSIFTTKVIIELKDCSGNLLATSLEGKSRIKEFDKSYTEAIRDAFKSIVDLKYKYNPNNEFVTKNTQANYNSKNTAGTEKTEISVAEVKRLKKELEDLKQQNKGEAEISEESSKKTKLKNNAITENESRTEVKKEVAKIQVSEEAKLNITLEVLYAQAISEGFQLVNAEPKVVMILLKTAAPNVFIVKDRDAIVFKQDNKWIYSENDGIAKFTEELNIKF